MTDAVHEKGGAIFAQIMHVGRLSDPLMLDGAQPVGASAVQPDPTARHYTVTCPRPKRATRPRALTTAEVYAVIEDYRRSAALARRPASTASRSTPPVAICRCSSCPPMPTCAAMNSAAA